MSAAGGEKGGPKERKETERGRGRTRWEHVSHTEIVNYSFVLCRSRSRSFGSETERVLYIARDGRVEKEETSESGEGLRGAEGTRTHGGAIRTRTGGSETAHSSFIGPLRPAACHGGYGGR